MLSKDEVARRIKAARELRGISQDDLARRVEELGLSYRTVGYLERADVEISDAQRVIVARALGMPERWLSAPIDEICTDVPDQTVTEQLVRIETRLERIERMLKGNDR